MGASRGWGSGIRGLGMSPCWDPALGCELSGLGGSEWLWDGAKKGIWEFNSQRGNEGRWQGMCQGKGCSLFPSLPRAGWQHPQAPARLFGHFLGWVQLPVGVTMSSRPLEMLPLLLPAQRARDSPHPPAASRAEEIWAPPAPQIRAINDAVFN